VINLVKCFAQVYSTKIRCTASLSELFYNITNNTNSKAASSLSSNSLRLFITRRFIGPASAIIPLCGVFVR